MMNVFFPLPFSLFMQYVGRTASAIISNLKGNRKLHCCSIDMEDDK